MFYDGIGNEIGAEMALIEANKLNVSAAAALNKTTVDQESGTATSHDGDTTELPPDGAADDQTVAADGETTDSKPPDGATKGIYEYSSVIMLRHNEMRCCLRCFKLAVY